MQFRQSCAGDIPALTEIWQACFDDSGAILDDFFRCFGTDCGVVGLLDDRVVAAAYILPTDGLITGDGRTLSCAYLYAIGVLPEFQDRGYGKAITKAAMERAKEGGYAYSALRPADRGLFDFYEKLGFISLFREDRWEASVAANGGDVLELTPEDYRQLREQALADMPHLALSPACAAFEGCLGKLLQLEGGCAAVESANGVAYVKELLVPTARERAALSSIGAVVDVGALQVSRPDMEGAFCGMICPGPGIPAAYLGPAFD